MAALVIIGQPFADLEFSPFIRIAQSCGEVGRRAISALPARKLRPVGLLFGIHVNMIQAEGGGPKSPTS